MIEVMVNGDREKTYAGRVRLDEIVGDVYPEGKVLESVEINGKEIPIAQMTEIFVKDGEKVVLKFISMKESISNIAKSALDFLGWIESQKMDDENLFSTLSKITSGFEVMENALFSIRSTGIRVESEEEQSKKVKLFEEINSLTVLEKKTEVRDKIKEVTHLYKKIFTRLLGGEGGLTYE